MVAADYVLLNDTDYCSQMDYDDERDTNVMLDEDEAIGEPPLREAFKKIKLVDFFNTSWTPPLKCGNTFWGEKNFQFYPGNDLPTHKNWMKWDKII